MAFGQLIAQEIKACPLAEVPSATPNAPPEYISVINLLGEPAPTCPAVVCGGDCEPALTWLVVAAARLGWLDVEAIRGSPGKWRYTIIPGTELEERAKGRTWSQLMDCLVRPEDFAAIAQNFQQKLQITTEK